jgi:hypothetical protein
MRRPPGILGTGQGVMIDPAALVRSAQGFIEPPLPVFFLHDLVNFGRTVQEQRRLQRKYQ